MWVFFVVLGLFLFVGLLALIGQRLPETYRARRRLTLPASVEEVWELLTDHRREPEWRPELAEVEVYGEQQGKPLWRERHKRGERRTLVTEESEAPHKLVRSLAGVERRSFTATWTYRLEALDESDSPRTQVTVEEEMNITHPVYRLLSRYVFGNGAFSQQYLTALAQHYDREPSAIEVLE